MSRRRRSAYLVVLGLETIVGIPLSGLIEFYNVSVRPLSLGDWVVAVVFHIEFVVLVVLIFFAWRSLLRTLL